MSTIIILGGGGFLAGHIARHYQKRGWRAVSVGRAAAEGIGHARHAWNLPHPEFGHLLAVEQPQICVMLPAVLRCLRRWSSRLPISKAARF